VSEGESPERELSHEELERLRGEELPDRTAMSLLNLNVAIPIDAAIAANVLSDESLAVADAEQDVEADQETGGTNG
jgi:hypothetical protein